MAAAAQELATTGSSVLAGVEGLGLGSILPPSSEAWTPAVLGDLRARVGELEEAAAGQRRA
ncbi:hypothetical protein ACT9SR_13415, partial [Enterococcus faecalis]|uniref:hypothetical protein n=1 Tax=Enterococcus faecalis TaxID=1351 RepID=UPI00403913A5